MTYLAWRKSFLIFLAFLATVTADACPTNDGSWSEIGAVENPTGTITFDDLGFSASLGWNSAGGNPLIAYQAGGRTASISSAGMVYSGLSVTTNKNKWDGQENWFDGGGKPGYYWVIFDSAQNYGELVFDVPVAMFSARNMGDANTFATTRMEAFDEQDNLIGCVTNIGENSGTNVFMYRGISTSSPIKKIRFYASQLLDDILFGA